MLGLVQNWFGPRCNPIGIDFGSDCLRLAQVQWADKDWRLVAAGSADVPVLLRDDPAGRWAFFAQTVRDLLGSGGFRGRTCVLGLPAATMHIQHLRMAKMDTDQLRKAIPWEARGKLPIDPAQSVIRHVVAGEVYVDQEPRNEVIVMAAHRDIVDQMLGAASKARLDVVGMNVEPLAVVDCFTQVYRRNADNETTNFFIDIGASGTRAVFARARQILFARSIAIGGNHFTAAVAEAMKTGADAARALRITISDSHAAVAASERGSLLPSADENGTQKVRVEDACAKPVAKLVEELDRCRRYYEATFPGKPVDRLIFIGGESRHRWICQQIARQLSVAAQLGDPLCRMNKQCEANLVSGIDRRQPQPAWAVAIGLSMGPPTGDTNGAAAERSAARQESRSTT
jgi:type IV pilus assembly protein PilM